MRVCRGFSLVEVLLVIAILAILSAMVYPVLAEVEQTSRATAMAVAVRDVREQIALHAALGTRPLAPSGFPAAPDRAWFFEGDFPVHVWSGAPMTLELVDGPESRIYPDDKSYDASSDGGTTRPTAWYNSANGSFCVRVPRAATESETLAVFYRVNDPGDTERTPKLLPSAR